MQIEDFKTWHWMLLGPIIGLVLGGTILWRGPGYDLANLETCDQGEFERAASGTPGTRWKDAMLPEYAGDHPWMKNVVVHPPVAGEPSKSYVVTGKIFSIDRARENPKDPKSPSEIVGKWDPFLYLAKVPYTAVVAEAGTYPDVVDYLKALEKNRSPQTVQFRVAWWDATAPTIVLPALAGFLIIGVAWPMTIHVLQGAGMAKVPQPKKVKPPRRPAAVTKTSADHSAGNRQLDELNTQLETDLSAAASNSRSKGAATATTETPVKVLSAGPETPAATAAAAAAEKERLIREYGGEFYPVVRSIHKEGEEESKS